MTIIEEKLGDLTNEFEIKVLKLAKEYRQEVLIPFCLENRIDFQSEDIGYWFVKNNKSFVHTDLNKLAIEGKLNSKEHIKLVEICKVLNLRITPDSYFYDYVSSFVSMYGNV